MGTWRVKCATLTIRKGGVIAYPTEAVYGLGCSPWNGNAVVRILALKRRRMAKGLIVVAANLEQLEPLVDFSSMASLEDVLASWPGPVTWVLPARGGVPVWLTGKHAGIAVRVSAHPLVRSLCDAAGPLVSTSANPEGHPPATSAFRVRAYFGNRIDYIVPGKTGLYKKPTEIRHAGLGAILRNGN